MKKTFNYLVFFCLLIPFSLHAQVLTSVSPDTVVQGETLTVSISGQNTNFSQGTTTSWLSRAVTVILPTINSVQNSTLLNSIYEIPSNAAVGFWDVHVMDGIAGEILMLDGVFIDQFVGLDPRAPGIKASIQVSPNPMLDHFDLEYSLPSKSQVQVRLFDIHGALIAELMNEYQGPGIKRNQYSVANVDLPAGIFLVVLNVDEMAFAVRVTALR